MGLPNIAKDRVARTFFFSALSLIATAVFAGYNLYLWFAYGAAWNIGIAVYYALLAGMRACILLCEGRLCGPAVSDEKKADVRTRLFFAQSIFLFAIDVALIVPISLMVLQQKEVRYTAIPAIATAAYTTYKIAVASWNYAKSRKEGHLSVKIFRNLNFVDALVSLLSLQYTLIMTFGEGVVGEMKTWCAISSLAVWAITVAVSFLTAARAVRLKRGRGKDEENRAG